MRLGTSSPKMMVMKVMKVTTIAVAATPASAGAQAQSCNQSASAR